MHISFWRSSLSVNVVLIVVALQPGCSDFAAPEPDIVKSPEEMVAEHRKKLPPVPDSLKPLAGELEELYKQQAFPRAKRGPDGIMVSQAFRHVLPAGLPYRMEQGGKMVEIELMYTPTTDDFLKKLENLPDLETIDLEGTKVTDAGFESLAKLPKLKELRVARTQVTEEGAAKFRESHPMCTVRGP